MTSFCGPGVGLLWIFAFPETAKKRPEHGDDVREETGVFRSIEVVLHFVGEHGAEADGIRILRRIRRAGLAGDIRGRKWDVHKEAHLWQSHDLPATEHTPRIISLFYYNPDGLSIDGDWKKRGKIEFFLNADTKNRSGGCRTGRENYLRLASSASIFLMGSMMEPTLISWLMAATK